VDTREWIPNDAYIRGTRLTKHVPCRPLLRHRVLRVPHLIEQQRPIIEENDIDVNWLRTVLMTGSQLQIEINESQY
jgi:hypothetical protein